MNVPNTLTLMRLMTMPAIVWLVQWHSRDGLIDYALALVIAGGALDKLDGYFARRLNQVTAFGGIVDPIVDKLWIHSILLFCSLQGITDPMFFWVALLRDLLVTDLRFGLPGPVQTKMADRSGKLKFRFQVLYVTAALAAYVLERHGLGFRGLHELVLGLLVVATFFVLYSAVVYVRKYGFGTGIASDAFRATTANPEAQ